MGDLSLAVCGQERFTYILRNPCEHDCSQSVPDAQPPERLVAALPSQPESLLGSSSRRGTGCGARLF